MPDQSHILNQLLHVAAGARVELLVEHLLEATQGRVQAGPFAGMALQAQASWGSGDVGSKLVGLYETELHPHVEQAVSRDPDLVVNVGCAEGYYAIGLARRLPGARVLAFDTSPVAQAVCRQAADLNGVADRVRVQGACDADTLVQAARGARRPLLVIDCEGGERDLLTAASVPQLAHCDMLVELHDFMDRSIRPALTPLLQAGHDVTTVREGGRDPSGCPMLHDMNALDRYLAVIELRPETMYWLVANRR